MLLRPRPIPPPQPGDIERFEASYAPSAGGCHLWTKGKFAEGYAAFRIGAKVYRAHRVAYAWASGDFDPDLDIDHLCHDPATCAGGFSCSHRACVNPDHLKPSTRRDNVLRGGGPTARNAKSEACGKCGTEYKFNNRGERYCPKCSLARTKRYQDANRVEVNRRKRERRAPVAHEERVCAFPACDNRFVPLRSTGVYCKDDDCVRARARLGR